MVFVDSMNAGLEIDSVNVAQEPLGQPDGVTTPLPHPETGYVYLWDDAFGIPGAHLWSMTAQVAIINGRPALGLGATVYFDPTKATGVMTGTDWLKGDLVANISTAEPCFQFGFDAGDTPWSIGGGGTVFIADGLSTLTAISIEAVLTAVLVYTVLLATADARAPKLGALLVGGVITANILIGGLLTGAAMNPARWFGPALALGDLSAAVVYIVGPLIGAVVAALSVRYLFAER